MKSRVPSIGSTSQISPPSSRCGASTVSSDSQPAAGSSAPSSRLRNCIDRQISGADRIATATFPTPRPRGRGLASRQRDPPASRTMPPGARGRSSGKSGIVKNDSQLTFIFLILPPIGAFQAFPAVLMRRRTTG
jgi:hypothetical protein